MISKTDNSGGSLNVISKTDHGYTLNLTPELHRGIKQFLKTAKRVAEAENAIMVLAESLKIKQILSLTQVKLSAEEKEIINKTLEFKKFVIKSFTNEHQQKITVVAVPILYSNGTICGSLFLKNKLYAESFSNDDALLLSNLCSHFIGILNSTSVNNDLNQTFISFHDGIELIQKNIILKKDNIEKKKLIGELIRVSQLINSTIDIQDLLESIMSSAKLVLRTEGSSLMLIDEKTNELFFNIITGEKEKELREIRVPIGKGIAGLVAQDKKPIIVNDAQLDDRVYKAVDEKAGFITRNLIACPLVIRDKVIGVLEVINTIGRKEFSEDELNLFKTFSEEAAIAIHNRELIRSLQNTNITLSKKVHELSSLHEISKTLISSQNEKSLYDQVAKILAEELNAKKVSIMLTSSNQALTIAATHGHQPDILNTTMSTERSIAGHALNHNMVIESRHLQEEPLSEYCIIERYQSKTCLIYPLISESNKYGVVNISDKIDENDFTEDDKRLLATIARQMTQTIQNFRLLEEMLDKKAYEKELEITSEIQKSILPLKKITNPHISYGFISISAKVMGGDFYDFEKHNDNTMSFLVADVSGKSLPAALFMALTSSIIRTLNREHPQPSELMKIANNLIYRNSQSGMFVTLFFLTYNSELSKIKYASAGHNEQFIYRPQTDEILFLDLKGIPLGVVPTSDKHPFEDGHIDVNTGELIVLYTDGVIEAINENEVEFGIDNFISLIKKYQHEEPQKIINQIYEDIKEYSGKMPQYDDFTMMIIKIEK